MKVESMPLEDLIFNIEILAGLESLRAYESGDFTTETACYYRESILHEAVRRLKKDEIT